MSNLIFIWMIFYEIIQSVNLPPGYSSLVGKTTILLSIRCKLISVMQFCLHNIASICHDKSIEFFFFYETVIGPHLEPPLPYNVIKDWKN